MHRATAPIGLLAAAVLAIGASGATRAQPAASGPPAVGIVEATKRPITETSEFLGRVEAVNRVNVVARVTAFLEKRLFIEGAEVANGFYLLNVADRDEAIKVASMIPATTVELRQLTGVAGL